MIRENFSKEESVPPSISQHGAHLDHMLRQTRMHHVQLSTMADFKANVMITLSSLIITFLIQHVSDPILRWPAITLIAFCGATVFAGAYAVMPRINDQKNINPNNKSTFNPLFFGSFMYMNYDEYEAMMCKSLSDPNSAYELQIREIYQMGVFLGHKKYRYVRIAYRLFLSGLFAAALVFLFVELTVVAGS